MCLCLFGRLHCFLHESMIELLSINKTSYISLGQIGNFHRQWMMFVWISRLCPFFFFFFFYIFVIFSRIFYFVFFIYLSFSLYIHTYISNGWVLMETLYRFLLFYFFFCFLFLSLLVIYQFHLCGKGLNSHYSSLPFLLLNLIFYLLFIWCIYVICWFFFLFFIYSKLPSSLFRSCCYFWSNSSVS